MSIRNGLIDVTALYGGDLNKKKTKTHARPHPIDRTSGVARWERA